MYTPPFTVTDEILHLVSEISEHIHVGVNVGINVGINEQRVLDALRADASLSAVKIGQLLGITTRQAERLLASLREKNLIRRMELTKMVIGR